MSAISRRVADGNIHRRQADDVIDALTDAAFFRLCKPRRFVGYPADLRTLLQVTETLAEADGSSAGVVAIAPTPAWAASRGSEQLQRDIFGADPRLRRMGGRRRGGDSGLDQRRVEARAAA